MKGESDYTFTEINVEVVHGPAPDKLPSGPAARGTKADAASLPAQTLAMIDQARKEGDTSTRPTGQDCAFKLADARAFQGCCSGSSAGTRPAPSH
jgi:hypothetical protein